MVLELFPLLPILLLISKLQTYITFYFSNQNSIPAKIGGQCCMMMLQIRGMRKLMAPLELLDSMNGAIVKNPKQARIRKISAKMPF